MNAAIANTTNNNALCRRSARRSGIPHRYGHDIMLQNVRDECNMLAPRTSARVGAQVLILSPNDHPHPSHGQQVFKKNLILYIQYAPPVVVYASNVPKRKLPQVVHIAEMFQGV